MNASISSVQNLTTFKPKVVDFSNYRENPSALKAHKAQELVEALRQKGIVVLKDNAFPYDIVKNTAAQINELLLQFPEDKSLLELFSPFGSGNPMADLSNSFWVNSPSEGEIRKSETIHKLALAFRPGRRLAEVAPELAKNWAEVFFATQKLMNNAYDALAMASLEYNKLMGAVTNRADWQWALQHRPVEGKDEVQQDSQHKDFILCTGGIYRSGPGFQGKTPNSEEWFDLNVQPNDFIFMLGSEIEPHLAGTPLADLKGLFHKVINNDPRLSILHFMLGEGGLERVLGGLKFMEMVQQSLTQQQFVKANI